MYMTMHVLHEGDFPQAPGLKWCRAGFRGLWSWINVGDNMWAQALWKPVGYLFSQINLFGLGFFYFVLEEM